jgi:hypothetical protein
LLQKIHNNSVISRHIHNAIYLPSRVQTESKMTSENISLKTIDEMWKVIESSGVSREVFSKHNPSFAEIRDLYLLLSQKQVSSKREIKT